MNATQAAEHVGVTERTMRRWIQRGQIQAEKVAGLRHRLRELCEQQAMEMTS